MGRQLSVRLAKVVEAIPGGGGANGPVKLAKAAGVDKVLASKVLRATACRDPIASLHLMPGTELLRRFATNASRRGVSKELIRDVEQAVTDFDELIRSEAGDRVGFDAILSSWVPEARAEFELRRKQAAYRSMSQILGRSVDLNLATAILFPSADGSRISIIWITGLLGLQRLRPGVAVRFASRRVGVPAGEVEPRRLLTLDGRRVDGLEGLQLPEYCSKPLPPLHAEHVGEVAHYTLGETGFGPKSKLDLVYAEVNRDELPRYVPTPPGSQPRRRYVFAELGTPAETLVFDAIVHQDLLTSVPPELLIYDTALEGVANVNDRTRDASRLDLLETMSPILLAGPSGLASYRVVEAPWYIELLASVCERMALPPQSLRGFRTRIHYPLYGSQVVIAFNTQTSAE